MWLTHTLVGPQIKEGTTLRWLLAHELHCDPMRITKKFTKDASIGKVRPVVVWGGGRSRVVVLPAVRSLHDGVCCAYVMAVSASVQEPRRTPHQ